MKYLKNSATNEIVKGESFGAFFDSWVELTQEEIDVYKLEQAKASKINECKAYLASTDWQIIRLSDPTSGEPLKEGVAENRSLARSLQDDIEACTTLEELNNININFE
jgi:hypothetical protein